MLKNIMLAAVLIFGFNFAQAVELTVVSNSVTKVGDKKAWVIKFDDFAPMDPTQVEKIISCYGTFNDLNKANLLRLLEVETIVEMQTNLQDMKHDDVPGYLTLATQTQYNAFIQGPFKSCLSN